MTIAAPNAPKGVYCLPGWQPAKLPYAISGTEGQNFRFTIEAEGYVPMKVEVPITIRRKSYEYNLEKNRKITWVYSICLERKKKEAVVEHSADPVKPAACM